MTGGRVSIYFSIRYFTPIMVLLAVAASTTHPNVDRLTGLLTAQIALGLPVSSWGTESNQTSKPITEVLA